MKYVKIYISIKSEADIVLSDLNPKKYCLIQSGGRRKIVKSGKIPLGQG
jgi:hypothetical protein